jgi:tetratricopeptide (TPR) repeat protein
MSVLIEALRQAESARAAHTPAAETVVPPLQAAVAARRPARAAYLGAGLAAALLAALGSAWWWLSSAQRAPAAPATQAAPAPIAAPAAADSAEPMAPAAQQSAANAAEAPARSQEVTSAPRRPRAVGALAHTPTPPPAQAQASAGAAPSPSPPPAADNIVARGEPPALEQAYRALQAGRYEEAYRLYESVLASQPNHPDALLGFAAVAEGRGEPARAIAAYRRVLQVDPDNADALAALAELTGAADPATQASVLRAAIARRPEAYSLHAALGRLLAAEGRHSEARVAFEAALALAPQRADYAFNLAVTWDRLGDAARARALYERAAALAERAPVAGFDPSVARARAAQLAAAGQ